MLVFGCPPCNNTNNRVKERENTLDVQLAELMLPLHGAKDPVAPCHVCLYCPLPHFPETRKRKIRRNSLSELADSSLTAHLLCRKI